MVFVSELIKTEYAIFLWITVAFLSLASFLVSIKGFFEFISWVIKVKEERTSEYNLAKRSTIKVAAGLVFLGFFWSSGSSLFSVYHNGRKTFTIRHNKSLVTNNKTGTIHLKNVSSGALPSTKWVSNKINLVRNKPYSGSARRIYEAIAVEALIQKNDFIATEAYLLAINVSPLSYHLYDKLTRIYGRKKEYSDIAKMYESAILNLSKLALNKRTLKRANEEFTMRLQRTKHRAQFA